MQIFVIEGLFENTARAQQVRYFLKAPRSQISTYTAEFGMIYTILSLDRTNMDSIDRPNFDILKVFL